MPPLPATTETGVGPISQETLLLFLLFPLTGRAAHALEDVRQPAAALGPLRGEPGPIGWVCHLPPSPGGRGRRWRGGWGRESARRDQRRARGGASCVDVCSLCSHFLCSRSTHGCLLLPRVPAPAAAALRAGSPPRRVSLLLARPLLTAAHPPPPSLPSSSSAL